MSGEELNLMKNEFQESSSVSLEKKRGRPARTIKSSLAYDLIEYFQHIGYKDKFSDSIESKAVQTFAASFPYRPISKVLADLESERYHELSSDMERGELYSSLINSIENRTIDLSSEQISKLTVLCSELSDKEWRKTLSAIRVRRKRNNDGKNAMRNITLKTGTYNEMQLLKTSHLKQNDLTWDELLMEMSRYTKACLTLMSHKGISSVDQFIEHVNSDAKR